MELPFADFYAVANLLYEGAWVAERYAAIAGFMAEKEASLHPVTRKIIGGARNLSAADAFKGIYALQALKVKLAPVIASVDMICVPTAPRHFTVDEVLADPIVTNSRLGTYTNFVNLLDLCGMAVPTGKRSDGLPMSVTLLAPAGRDDLVASLASRLHAASGLALGATGWTATVPDLPKRAADAGEIELVVVGAHLSGMPLNGDLKRLGGRFLRAVQTRPDYQLFALAEQSVPKPGLQRVGRATGRSDRGRGLGPSAPSIRDVRGCHPAATRDRHDPACRRDRAQGFSGRVRGPRGGRRHFVLRRLAELHRARHATGGIGRRSPVIVSGNRRKGRPQDTLRCLARACRSRRSWVGSAAGRTAVWQFRRPSLRGSKTTTPRGRARRGPTRRPRPTPRSSKAA